MNERRCRCEATMPPEVLEGFSCGFADCWRAPIVQASFDAFVAGLDPRTRRGATAAAAAPRRDERLRRRIGGLSGAATYAIPRGGSPTF